MVKDILVNAIDNDDFPEKQMSHLGALEKWSARAEKYVEMARRGLDSAEELFPGTKEEVKSQIVQGMRLANAGQEVMRNVPLGDFVSLKELPPAIEAEDAASKKKKFIKAGFTDKHNWHLEIGGKGVAAAGGMIAAKSDDDLLQIDLRGLRKHISEVNPETGLSLIEQVMAEALSSTGKYEFLNVNNYPALHREFDSICNAVPTHSDDPHVLKYLEQHENKPFIPRVVVLDGEPQAMAGLMPFADEPILFVTRKLIENNTTLQAANVLRHELGHAYKQTRDYHLTKTMATQMIPILGTKARHREERRADMFAPRDSEDLRQTANALKILGDHYEDLEDRYRAVLGIMLRNGVVDEMINDFMEDGKKHLDTARQKLRNWVANAFEATLGNEKANELRQTPEVSIVTKGAEKIGHLASRIVKRKLEKTSVSSQVLEEDSRDILKQRKKLVERSSKSHPSLSGRIDTLESAADTLDLESKSKGRGR